MEKVQVPKLDNSGNPVVTPAVTKPMDALMAFLEAQAKTIEALAGKVDALAESKARDIAPVTPATVTPAATTAADRMAKARAAKAAKAAGKASGKATTTATTAQTCYALGHKLYSADKRGCSGCKHGKPANPVTLKALTVRNCLSAYGNLQAACEVVKAAAAHDWVYTWAYNAHGDYVGKNHTFPITPESVRADYKKNSERYAF